MRASISKSRISGSATAPSSKSYTIRGLMCAALANGTSEIIHPLSSDDTEAAWDVLDKIGVRINAGKDSWLVTGGNFHTPHADLSCRESAATLRFMTAIAALVPGECRLCAAPSLARRPISPLLQALSQLGVGCVQDDKGCVVVRGGKLKGGITELPGNISSQYVTALLFISPFAENGMKIKLTTPLESQPYVLMTLECLEQFGVSVISSPDLREFETSRQTYRSARYVVEGDWSSASYLLGLGALAGQIKVNNLNPASLQGDRTIVRFLQEMGASVTIDTAAITVSQARLRAIKADLTDCIDLLPTMAALAAAAEGTSELTGIERGRLKESNRVGALREGLERMGIGVIEEKDRLAVTGGRLRGATIDSKGDHRIAMSFSLLGAVAGNTVIDGAECVSKTYPEYWDVLKTIGSKVTLDGK